MDEIRGPVELKVHGIIPIWAEGTLYRTGPGVRTIEDTPQGKYKISHWFDGFAHSHKFEIVAVIGENENGTRNGEVGASNSGSSNNYENKNHRIKVLYSSRRQSEGMMASIRRNGDRDYFSFGQKRDPCMGLFAKLMSVYRMATPRRHTVADNVCVAVFADVPGLESTVQVKRDRTRRKRGTLTGTGHRGANVCNVWATTDTDALKEMDPETLEPIGFAVQSSLHPALKGPLSCAHAQRDPITGDMFNFNLSLGRSTTYRVFRVNADTGTTDILATISLRDLGPTYIHSFFLTERFVILCCTSATIAWKGMKILWEKNVVSSFEPFRKERKMRWFVVDRRKGPRESKGVLARFESEAGFFFHSVNAFEELVSGAERGKEVDIFCDFVYYRNLDVIQGLYYDILTDSNNAAQKFWGDPKHHVDGHSQLVRYRFRTPDPDYTPSTDEECRGLSAAELSNPQPNVSLSDPAKPVPITSLAVGTPECMLHIPAPHIGELPTINMEKHMTRHRYVYSLCNRGNSTLLDCLAKTDLETRIVKYWDSPHGHTPGEAIFLPRPCLPDEKGNMMEDDGVLLSVVLDSLAKTSYLVCLDARTMTELGRATCDFPISLGFHGLFAPPRGVADSLRI